MPYIFNSNIRSVTERPGELKIDTMLTYRKICENNMDNLRLQIYTSENFFKIVRLLLIF